jgi:predicted phosphodiesterase
MGRDCIEHMFDSQPTVLCMRLILASDTHDRHHRLVVPDGDVFIHAGDFTMRGDIQKVAAFGRWIRGLPHQQKIIIAGNHELTFEDDLAVELDALGVARDGLIYLQDSGTTINGISFWGSPWQPWFNDWAFNLPRGAPIAEKWTLIPERTDVLITHGPPMGILDFIDDENVGCADLLDRVLSLKPKLHVFGHIHAGSGMEVRDGITFVNASICDESYNATNPVRVIDL